MKHIFLYMLLLIAITACADNTASPTDEGISSSSGGGNCNDDLCIKLTTEEPIMVGEPVTLTITVTSEKDISDLQITLSSAPQKISIVEPDSQGWKEGNASWAVKNAQAGQSLVFTRNVLVPIKKEAYTSQYTIVVDAFTQQLGLLASTFITFYFTDEGLKVNYPGTKIPITPGPLPMTVYYDTYTPGPSPTPDNATPNPVVTEQFILISPVAITITPSP
jgi:hypothetical protein